MADIKTLTVNLKNLMNKWFYTREQIHQLLEEYVTVNQQGILNVGLNTATDIALTTTNNAITTADVAECTATVTDSNDNGVYGVPVQFVNRKTREVLYDGISDENGECDFRYFTDDAEILPIQAKIAGEFLFRDEGILNSYTAWGSGAQQNLVLERYNTYSKMRKSDTSSSNGYMRSLRLSGYTDIDFEAKTYDAGGATDFIEIIECNANDGMVGNGFDIQLDHNDFNLTANEWHHFHISILDDRLVLYSKDTGESNTIWHDGLPTYYCFRLNFSYLVGAIDFRDVKISRCSDDLSMFIKDKNNLSTFNQWSCGDYTNDLTDFHKSGINESTFEVIETSSTNGESSIKTTRLTSNSAYSYLFIQLPISSDMIGETIDRKSVV